MRRYKGRIKVWDVVNEAISMAARMSAKVAVVVIIGPDFIEKAFNTPTRPILMRSSAITITPGEPGKTPEAH